MSTNCGANIYGAFESKPAAAAGFDALCEQTYDAYLTEVNKVLAQNKTSGFKIRYTAHPVPVVANAPGNYSPSIIKDFYVKRSATNVGRFDVTEVLIHFDDPKQPKEVNGGGGAAKVRCDVDFFPEARVNGRRIPLVDGLFYRWHSLPCGGGVGEYCSVEVSAAHILSDEVIAEWSP